MGVWYYLYCHAGSIHRAILCQKKEKETVWKMKWNDAECADCSLFPSMGPHSPLPSFFWYDKCQHHVHSSFNCFAAFPRHESGDDTGRWHVTAWNCFIFYFSFHFSAAIQQAFIISSDTHLNCYPKVWHRLQPQFYETHISQCDMQWTRLFLLQCGHQSQNVTTGFPIRSFMCGGQPQYQHCPPHINFLFLEPCAPLSFSPSLSLTLDQPSL